MEPTTTKAGEASVDEAPSSSKRNRVPGKDVNNNPIAASRELGYYCFDAVISRLESKACAPPNFTDATCPVCISWARSRKEPPSAKRPGAYMNSQKKPTVSQFEARGSLFTHPLRLHSEDFLRSIYDR
eukprot:TRINITY_DN1201_c0_g1_i2.p1 TRINITY_DN1201_c0_g1~~TRINITY_DN1201_c0_g1_i2.p1  ORF type:complete len:128 (-),score=15.24 TRINITY_DN1201_c0_g1_i2:83-466(-)